ncbi:MAG TPA: hypothetical protein IGQ16_11460 [Thermosynechococcus sp. M3746_W2019_013]|jgi:hypothetical protein|uniref:hypothetical protein n=1 Tax=Thermosynechococcus sp. M3746_W2019_013 TaxID=2747806 RepID=UPI0019E891D3|nr:hypothetical protein [Thermosynechococcus sp. M3746_W2019_013]HIK24254.1 hypothetical protein [Thermosynechococcus sp. M3746_W2019_013]
MRFEYDLLIVAASPLALDLAYRCAPLGRIGLVIPPPDEQWQWQWQRWWLSQFPPLSLDAQHWQHFQAHLRHGQRRYAPRVLELVGVDVITGVGEFVWRPRCHFQVGGDRLYARGYLLLDAPAAMDFHDLDALSRIERACWHHWSGKASDANGQGLPVVTTEDAWFNDRLHAALSGLGLGVPLLGRRKAPDPTSLNVQHLQRDAQGWLRINPQGRTSHPQVYACGGWQRGYHLPSLTFFEAFAIARQILQRKPITLDYYRQPWWIALPVPIARVGWNVRQAQQYLREPIQCWEIQQLTPEGQSLGQVVINRQGQLLGATLMGRAAIASSRIFSRYLDQNAFAAITYAGWELECQRQRSPKAPRSPNAGKG